MKEGTWRACSIRGRNLWITLGVLVGLVLLAFLGRLDRGPRERPEQARANPDLLALPKQRFRFSWVAGADSLMLARLIPVIQRDQLTRKKLEDGRPGRGRTEFVTRAERPLSHASALVGLTNLPLRRNWCPRCDAREAVA